MNIRVIGVVLLVVIFAGASLMLSLSVSGGLPLNEAYSSGNIKVIQKTAAGTIPHEVEISNDGDTAVNIKKGNVLSSSVSEDLIIAEDKKVAPGSKQTLKAYGIEPSQRAVVNSKLLPVNNTYNALTKVISNSSVDDSQSAYNAQLKIWIVMSGGNLNPYTGEPVAVVETKQITWTQFRQNLADAKSDILRTFNVDESGIGNLNQNMGVDPQNWIDGSVNWIKNSLGIK